MTLLAFACGRDTRSSLSGRWRASQIEWTQDDRKVRLTAEGEMQIGRFKLPQRPGSFEPMIRTMKNVTIELTQSGDELRGSVHAGADATASVLRQIGATPGSAIAQFEGNLVNDTLGSVVVTTPDGRRRDIVLRIEDNGRRIVARAVPVVGESAERASDIVLVGVDAER